MLASLRDRHAVALRQYEQKRQELATLKTQLETTSKLVEISSEAEARVGELFVRKHVPRDRYEAAVRRATQQRGNAEVLRMQIKTAEIAVEEFRSRLESVSSLDRAEAHRILHEATSQLAEAEELVVKLTSKLGALEIRSPVEGIVKGPSLTAVGSVARPAAPLMTIVPIDEQLVARVQIKPKDIGVGRHRHRLAHSARVPRQTNPLRARCGAFRAIGDHSHAERRRHARSGSQGRPTAGRSPASGTQGRIKSLLVRIKPLLIESIREMNALVKNGSAEMAGGELARGELAEGEMAG